MSAQVHTHVASYHRPSSAMVALSTSDLLVLVAGLVGAVVYLFRDILFVSKPAEPLVALKTGVAGDPDIDSRDFVAKLKASKKRLVIFYGSQTGTAEEYAIRLAKEAKSKFGLGSLVCDPEEYDFENLDQVPEDCAVFFVMATYGEGEPTDNAVTLLQNLRDDEFAYSKGSHTLDGLKYVVFGLGNRTYEHYNVISKFVDEALTASGATRIGSRGEGDDDKSMEEDYLAWKDGMWEEFAQVMGVEEGSGGDSADFVVSELSGVDNAKVYLGELSARALNRTKGIHDAKNPYAAPIDKIEELFAVSHDRNCVHVEFNIAGSGLTYQHGDHVGVWPSNPDVEVNRLLHALGLYEKRDTVIGIESLDPALAKVPFPVPTTYLTVFRHYIDISAVAGRQILFALSKYAPTEEAKAVLAQFGSDKVVYADNVAKPCLKLGEVLQVAAGNDINLIPSQQNTTPWSIPFDVIISAIPRLQPRYYSISSSPKLYPQTIHVTCVVLKYESEQSSKTPSKTVFGVGSNYLLNLKMAANGETAPLATTNGDAQANGGPVPASVSNPTYAIEGPRSAYVSSADKLFKAPIHVRRSTFRLPTNPKLPIIMIGPGTGVAPFRGFVQERVALARKALEKNGPEALSTWGPLTLYYGCRSESEDFLYRSEWDSYASELKGVFTMRNAFSRSGPRKPDGSKIYVQDLLWEDKEKLAGFILDGKGAVYVCGDAKAMARAVEETLERILSEREGVDGVKEVKMMKERSRYLSDVWS